MKGTVGELGEFGLIRELTSRLTTTPAVRVGPGDDAAVVAAPDRRVVASTDILLEGRHFRTTHEGGAGNDVCHAERHLVGDLGVSGAQVHQRNLSRREQLHRDAHNCMTPV